MPWNEVNLMKQRQTFIESLLLPGVQVSSLCAAQGISRKTAYKWLKRYQKKGLEGLAELPNGILAVSEGLTGSDAAGTTSSGFLWDGEAWQATALRRRDLLAPVGAAPLPDGSGVLLLERHWSPIGGIRVRLLRLDAADIVPGGVATSQELAFFQPPLIADNFEGVASRRTPQGETLVYLVSDDNFNVLQRSLLLMFAIVE